VYVARFILTLYMIGDSSREFSEVAEL